MGRNLRSRKAKVVKGEKNVPEEIPSSTAASVILTQETNKKEDEDVEMRVDVEETEVVEGEGTEESQTLLHIRREAVEALARGDEEEDAAPPSSQPRPITQESMEEDVADKSAENIGAEDKDEDSFEGEYSYADLSENFSAQDGAELDGLDLEAFEYDPQDKEFLEELLAVAPDKEKALLKRLSVVNDVGLPAINPATATTTDAAMSAEAETIFHLAKKYISRERIWTRPMVKANRKTFRSMVFTYVTGVGSLSQVEASAVLKAVYQSWVTDPKLMEKRAAVAEEKRIVMEAAAQRRLEKAMAHKAVLWENGRERREADLAEKNSRPSKTRRSMKEKLADNEAKREEDVAQLAVEEAAKSLDDAKSRALNKRKRTPEEDEHTDSAPFTSTANPNMSNGRQSKNAAAEQQVKLVGAQDWYGDEGEEKTWESSQPRKKRARKAKNGPAVSAHFASSSAKAKGPSVLITTEDVVMEDASENASEISAQVTDSAVQRRDSSLIGNTADDEDRPITFSGGGGNAVERVLRTEETLQPVSIKPSVKTHQIEQSKSRVQEITITKKEKRTMTEAQLRQQNLEEARAIKKMVGVARAAVEAVKDDVEETVLENEFNMPAAKRLEREAKARAENKKPRTKRPRNKNKLKVEAPVLPQVKVNTPKAKKTKADDEKAKQERLAFLAAQERDNNDPAVVAKRLADGLSARGKKLRTRGGRNKDPKSAPVVSVPTATTTPATDALATKDNASTKTRAPAHAPAIDALATTVNADSEKPTDTPKFKKSRRGGKKAVKIDTAEVPVSKDHHS